MYYPVTSPWWLKKLFPSCIWDIQTEEKIIYLSFDDGPHPVATPFVLETLKKYNAKASFFCIGKNVLAHSELYAQIMADGHATGNHTFDHLDGWRNTHEVYLDNISKAGTFIHSKLFRPPYGKIKYGHLKVLKKEPFLFKTIMWSVLSADFDKRVSKEKCLHNVIRHATNGSIVVFHDSEKAWKNMHYALPGVLEYFSNKGFRFEKIGAESL